MTILGYGHEVWALPAVLGLTLFAYLAGCLRGQEIGFVRGYRKAREFDRLAAPLLHRKRLGFPNRDRTLAEKSDRAGAPVSSSKPPEDAP